uniref:Protein phosphatase 1, regulatory (inhibitor) subunit 2 n=1 Tax=Oreochromis niloticus TaxID=8128 RepID=A0A669EPW1_ORENI
MLLFPFCLKLHPTIKDRFESGVDRYTEGVMPVSMFHLSESSGKKSQKWDEMNILATYHPPDKDYGLMKIDEPSTPYNRMIGDDEDEGALSDSDGQSGLAVDDLASKLVAAEGSEPRFMKEEEESSEEEEEELTPEEQAKKKQFQMMRKMHYNEGLNIKLARQLIASELEDDEDEEMRDDTEETEEISVDPPQEADSLDS